MNIYVLEFNYGDKTVTKYYTFNPLKVFTTRQLASIYFKITTSFGNIAEDFKLWYIKLHNENHFGVLELIPKRYNKAFYDYLDINKVKPREFIQRNDVDLRRINVTDYINWENNE